MGTQISAIQFKGKVGNLIGRVVDGKAIISHGGGLTSEKIHAGRHTRYKRLWENASEFGRSSNLASSIHRPIRSIHKSSHAQKRAYARLVGQLQLFLRYDTESARGKRKHNDTALSKLVGFKYNPLAQEILTTSPKIICATANSLSLTISNPHNSIKWPESSTRANLFIYAYPFLEEIGQMGKPIYSTLPIDIDSTSPEVELTYPTPIENSLILFGISFQEEVNGKFYNLSDKSHSPLTVLHYQMT